MHSPPASQAPPVRAEWSLAARARLLQWVIPCALLAGIALSPRLWIVSRAYPLCPLVPGLRLPNPWDLALIAAFALAAALCAVAPRPARILLITVLLGGVLVLFDRSRLQPWFYQYLLMLAALAWFYSSPQPARRLSALTACRLLMASIYFWSGVQKINPHFAPEIAPFMAQPLADSFPRLRPAVDAIGPFIPFAELAIGLALLSPRSRGAAAAAAIAMHCAILAALGPLGRNANSVIWPWNLAMIAAVVILFRRTPALPARAILLPSGPPLWRAAALVVALGPALSLVGLWNNYLAWSLYSGNKDEAAVFIDDALFNRLPAAVQDHVYDDAPDRNELDIYEWSWSELNVPVYPELPVYRSITAALCRYASRPASVEVTVTRKLLFAGQARPALEWSCRGIP